MALNHEVLHKTATRDSCSAPCLLTNPETGSGLCCTCVAGSGNTAPGFAESAVMELVMVVKGLKDDVEKINRRNRDWQVGGNVRGTQRHTRYPYPCRNGDSCRFFACNKCWSVHEASGATAEGDALDGDKCTSPPETSDSTSIKEIAKSSEKKMDAPEAMLRVNPGLLEAPFSFVDAQIASIDVKIEEVQTALDKHEKDIEELTIEMKACTRSIINGQGFRDRFDEARQKIISLDEESSNEDLRRKDADIDVIMNTLREEHIEIRKVQEKVTVLETRLDKFENSRVHLQVPHAQRDQTKDRGAEWDPNRKKWFVGSNKVSALSRWLPKAGAGQRG